MTQQRAHHSEIQLLRSLHQRVAKGVDALQRLYERTPEDELRLRMQERLEQRLRDRIAWLQAQYAPRSRTGAAPDSGRLLAL